MVRGWLPWKPLMFSGSYVPITTSRQGCILHIVVVDYNECTLCGACFGMFVTRYYLTTDSKHINTQLSMTVIFRK